MHPHFLLSLLLLLILSIQTLSDQGERSALLDFKNSTRSDPLGLLSRWSGAEHCSWPGVACDASLRVVALNLSGSSSSDPTRKLSGRLTPSLGRLTALTTLSLPFQNLDGEIPDELWRLTKLEIVDLEGNSISGTLASASVFPSSLRVVNLASNSITGEIPPSLASCLYLETLDLSRNKLKGSIPNFLGSFSKLRVLRLSYNQLGGPIPVEIGGCESLEHLELSGNLLIRGIPPSLGNCSDMKYLILSSNLLEGSVPPELGKLKKLRVLDVSRNCFSGVVPAGLGDCVELEVLVLSSQYEPMLSMSSSNGAKNDDFNYFQGGISEKITSLSQLRVLWAPRAMLEGVFPKNWGECKSLEVVNLGGNFFKGEIPPSFGACENLKLLNLSSNILTGWLTDDLPVSCLSVFDVSGNKFSGMVPKFIYRKCPSSSFMPDDFPALYSSFFLDKARQELALPSFESPGDSVVYHNFGRNYFSGSLPSFPTDNSGKQTVYALFADENSLVGSLNDTLYGMCNYFHGLILNLRSNLISGGVPVNIGTTCRALIVLDVAGNEISGMIPRSLGLLGILVGLDLSMNRLQGKIPTDLGKLSSLKYLSLAGNNLSGHIPTEFEQLHSLQSLDLSSNSLTGEIPSSLTRLTNLTIVLLNNNKLYGDIPSGFANSTQLTMFNASYNNLSGPLPSNASSPRCESLIGNPLLQLCNMSSLSVPPSYVQGRSSNSQSYAEPPESSPRKTSGFNSIEIASVTSAVVIVVVLLLLILLYIYTRKCAPGSSANSLGRREVAIFVDIGVPLTYEGVVRATGNFNASNCIGSGGFGATYKAEISPGVLVAIKRLSVGRIQGVQQFHAEIKTLGRWRHPNLVTLIGYHIGDAEMFLIYNYLPGGNLERFIQERSKRATDWRMLHKIALDVAKALAYLHDQCVPRILHRDVKPSNILLDNDFNACLSDFGLARLLGNSETHATTGVAGTFGYVAPEYAMTCRVSDKADVYSYGVVLLELLSDKKALDPSFSPYGNGFNIVTWAGLLLEEGRAHEFFTEGLWDVAPHDDLAETLHLAIRCTGDSLPVRPAMNQVVRRLKELEPPC